MIKMNATSDHIFQLITNAINASRPVGNSNLSFEDKKYTVSEIMRTISLPEFALGRDLFQIDYFKGRMVKLVIRKTATCFKLPAGAADPEYQSWSYKYPTYEDLVASIDVEWSHSND
jgi:hypothetical protein